MLAHLGRMEFFKPELIPESVYYLSAFKVLEEEGLPGLVRTLRSTIMSRKTSFLVLDGFVSAGEASHSPKELKKFIHELQSFTTMAGCTTLLLSSNEQPTDFQPEHTMVDGIIELSDELSESRPLRHLRVRKMRGVDQVRGQHTIEITGRGMVVHRRLESQLRAPPQMPGNAYRERIPLGIEEMDKMLGGGLPGRSTTMILGPSGVGKTILGLHFLAEGVRNQEPGLYFGFYEDPASIRHKSERLGLGLEKAVSSHLFDILWNPPTEHVIDVLGEQLFSAVEKLQAKRVFIDGLSGFRRALDDFPERLRGVFVTITQELERRGCTIMFAAETPALFGPTIEIPLPDVSAVTENILLLRHVEVQSRLHRLVSIVKVRDGAYDPAIREFCITDTGVEIGPDFASHERILTGSARAKKKAPPRRSPLKKKGRKRTKKA